MNTKCVYLACELVGALGLAAALGLAGAFGFGAALGLAATGAAIDASVPNGTTSALVSATGADSTLGAGVSTLYGVATGDCTGSLPNKNSLIL